MTTWINVNPNYPAINAEAVLADEDSIFYHYQQLVALRRGELKDLMVYASFAPADSVQVPHDEDEAVYAYTRTGGADGSPANESLLVISNFTADELERDFAVLAEARESGARVELVSSNYKDDAGSTLRPYEAKVYHIVR